MTILKCPKCGAELAVIPVERLSPKTLSVWNDAGFRFQHGLEEIGPKTLGARVGITNASYHLDLLVEAGLVRKIPQNRFKRVRHLYTGTLSKDHHHR